MPAENLRRHPREATRISARVVIDEHPLEGSVENIGEGGAFFVTDTLEGGVEVGDRVTLELSPYDLTRGRITYRYK